MGLDVEAAESRRMVTMTACAHVALHLTLYVAGVLSGVIFTFMGVIIKKERAEQVRRAGLTRLEERLSPDVPDWVVMQK